MLCGCQCHAPPPPVGDNRGHGGGYDNVINQNPFPQGQVNLLNALHFPYLIGWEKGRAFDLVFKHWKKVSTACTLGTIDIIISSIANRVHEAKNEGDSST